MVKQLRQVAGVRQVKVVDFKRGLFALTPPRGGRISNGAISAAVARSGFTLARIVAPSATKSGKSADSSSPGLIKKRSAEAIITKLLAAPRKAFREADYKKASELADALVARIRRKTIKQPGGNAARRNEPGAEIDQFRSLALFASGKFDQAAKAAHVALDRGKHWKWKTLRGHYKKAAQYASQLRTLENSIRKKSTAEKRFLVAYHYLMLGQPKAARAQFRRVARAKPNDKIVARLLQDLEKEKSDD